MKLLLLLAVILLGAWLWRGRRQGAAQAPKNRPSAPAPVQDMVSCAHCGVHIPQGDAVAGRAALYCSIEHRQQAES